MKVSEKPLSAGPIADDDEFYFIDKSEPAANQSQRTEFSIIRDSLGILKAEDLNVGDFIQVQDVGGEKKFVNVPASSLPVDDNILFVKEGDDLAAIAATAVAGQLVDVGPGTYALGSGQVIIKDGVNFRFAPGVTISSDNVNGTFYDNNVQVTSQWQGEPTITNSNGWDRKIYLQNTLSKTEGFYFSLDFLFTQLSTGDPISVIKKDTLGESFTLHRSDIGEYTLQFDNIIFSASNTPMFLPIPVRADYTSTSNVFKTGVQSGTSNIHIKTYDGTLTDGTIRLLIKIRVYPYRYNI